MWIREDPEITAAWRAAFDSIEKLWAQALGGEPEPAIVAYKIENTGKVTQFRFIWSRQTEKFKRQFIERMLALAPFENIQGERTLTETWIGIAPITKLESQWYNEAKELENAGNFEGTEQKWLETIAAETSLYGADSPVLARVRFNYAEFYRRIGRYEDFIEQMTMAANLFEDCFKQSSYEYGRQLLSAHLSIAHFADENEDFAKAARHYIRCLQLDESLSGLYLE